MTFMPPLETHIIFRTDWKYTSVQHCPDGAHHLFFWAEPVIYVSLVSVCGHGCLLSDGVDSYQFCS